MQHVTVAFPAPALPQPRHRLTRAVRRLRVLKRRILNSPRGSARMATGLLLTLLGIFGVGEAHAVAQLSGSLATVGAGVLTFFWGAHVAPGGVHAYADLPGRKAQ